jgi:hypothetical protein
MRTLVAVGLAALTALVVAGFIDRSGATSIPGQSELMHLPNPVRVVIEGEKWSALLSPDSFPRQ